MKKKNGVYDPCPSCDTPNPNKSTKCIKCKRDLRKGKSGKINK